MKRSILTLAATAALLAGGATAAQATTTCYSVPVPAVPAVYSTTVTPAVTVTEYEFTHAQDGNGQGNGQGPDNQWTENANWNAQGNAHSVGWEATGNTRVRVVEVEKTTTVLVSAEIPAGTIEECLELPDGVSPVPPGSEIPPAVGVNHDPVAPAPVEAPVAPVAPVVLAEAPVAPVAPVVLAEAPVAPALEAPAPVAVEAPVQTVPVTSTETLPAELAYTGAQDWVLPTGLALTAAGAAAIVLSRRFNPAK